MATGLLPGLAACAPALDGIGLAAGDVDALLRRVGVTRLADATGLDSLKVPVWSGIRPGSKSFAVSFGKGSSVPQAQISAIMETLENAFAENAASRIVRTASITEMLAAGATVVPLENLSRCDPGALDRNRPISWVTGRGLRTGRTACAPVDLVGLDYTDEAALPCFTRASIGLAAHTHLGGAILHAILELLEHDAVARVDQLPGFPGLLPRLPLDAAPSLVRSAIDAGGLRDARPRFHLVPSGGEVRTVLCSIRRHDEATGTGDSRCFGVASRFDMACAAIAALTEAAQVRMTLITAAREDLEDHHYVRGTPGPEIPATTVPWGEAPERSRPGRRGPTRAASDLVSLFDDEPFVFELTDRADKVKVVRVLAPGLITTLDVSRSLGVDAIGMLLALGKGMVP